MAKPKLIVFDLDYTLWPFWVDTHVDPPFKQEKSGRVIDSRGRVVKYYPDSYDILKKLKEEGYLLAAASRTTTTKEANDLCRMFGFDPFFDFKEIYPGSKTRHFSKFQQDSKLPYSDMLFFDDEHRNIADISKLGVTCVLAGDGMSWAVVRNGIKKFADSK